MKKVKRLLSTSRTFLKLDFNIKIRFFKAFIYTGIARAFILFVPFNKLKKHMGKVRVESPNEVDRDTYIIVRHISEVIERVSRHTPWESKCLVKALTVQRLLKESGISSTIYLGVRKDSNNNMMAHAWIRCGQYFLTGGAIRDQYAVVAKFSN